LKLSAILEEDEYRSLYPGYAELAEKEGFVEIASFFRNVAVAEKYHAERFLKLIREIEIGSSFNRDKVVTWRCLKCGFITESESAPKSCSLCCHPRAFFEVPGENW